jgi:hypothetical protein
MMDSEEGAFNRNKKRAVNKKKELRLLIDPGESTDDQDTGS